MPALANRSEGGGTRPVRVLKSNVRMVFASVATNGGLAGSALFHLWAFTGPSRLSPRLWKTLHARVGSALVIRNPVLASRAAAFFVTSGYTRRVGLVVNAFALSGETNQLVEVRRAQVEHAPQDVSFRLLLAEALRKDTTHGLYNDPKIGLIAQGIGRRAEALGVLTEALELAPHDSALHAAMGTLLLHLGHSAEAVTHLQTSFEARPDAAIAVQLGMALQKPEISDFEGASEAYRVALGIDPEIAGAAARLSSVSVRTERWDGWNFLMGQQAQNPDTQREELFLDFERLFHAPEVETDVSDMVDRLRKYVLAGGQFEKELVRSIAARLQYIGRFTPAFEVKEILALRELHNTLRLGESLNELQARAQALAYLGRSAQVLEMFQPLPWTPRGRREELIMKKLAADASLAMGDPGPLIDYERLDPPGLPLPGSDRMDELVRGKRVAIVGPSPSAELHGEEIDGFDTVIRPRFRRDFVREHALTGGARTDISYYSSTDIGSLLSEIREAAESGDIKLAVLRPVLYTALARELENAPWMRFYRHDYSLLFLGSPLGITRILYDVIPFEPSEIRIFNVDLYTGTKAFATGYRDPKDEHIAADSILNDLFRAHDLRAEFDLMRALFLNGVFTANDLTANILNLSTPEYLSLLDSSKAFRG